MIATVISRTRRYYYNLVAKVIIYQKSRWLFTLCLVALYAERSYGMSYSIVTYLIGFYLLQLLVGYLTPKGLEIEEDPFSFEENNWLLEQ